MIQESLIRIQIDGGHWGLYSLEATLSPTHNVCSTKF